MTPTVDLVKGQNMSWPDTTVVVELCLTGKTGSDVSALDLSGLLVDAGQRVSSSADLVFYNQPSAIGAVLEPGPPQRLRLDLAALRCEAVLCVASVDPGVAPLGRGPALTAVLRGADGTERARFALSGLTDERAVIAVEVYRRGSGWKVRAVAQGYTRGLVEAVTAHGVDVDDEVHAEAGQPAAPAPPAAPAERAAPPPPGTSDAERLYREAAGIFEDAARSTAGLRSSVGYAKRRRDAVLEHAVADSSLRSGPAAHRAGARAHAEHDALVQQARERHGRDVDQLTHELARYELRLPPSMAHWASPVWHRWQHPQGHAAAVRVGELHVDEAPSLRLPMLLGLPLLRPLWVDTRSDTGGSAARMVRAIVARMLAAGPPGGLVVLAADLGGGLTSALAPLGQPGSRVMPAPVASTVPALRHLLDQLVRRVDLVQMARSAGALDELSGDAAAERLLVLGDFPTGFDDVAVGIVRYLVDEGPAAGVQVLLTGEQGPVMGGGPLVSTVFRDSLRLPVLPDDHIADGWTGTSWNFSPDLGPDDARVLESVLRSAAGLDQA